MTRRPVRVLPLVAAPALLLLCASAVRAFLLLPHFEEWDQYTPPVEHYVKWFDADIPVHYQICAVYDEPSIPGEGEKDAVRAGFTTWEDEPSATVAFAEDPETFTVAECDYIYDSRNTVTFADPHSDLPSGVLGAAQTWFNPWCGSPEWSSG